MKNRSELYRFDALLGTQPDARIAKLAQVTQGAVNKRRRSLGIASYNSKTPSRITKYDCLLGVLPDQIVAHIAGVTKAP